MTDAAALKNQGNEHFQNGDWLKAAALYTQALKLDPDNAVLYSNRSAALLKLKKVKKAQEDAERAVALRPEWDKGYIRRAAIHEELENLAEALEEYTVASKLNPGNKEMSQKV
ncbi:hypothetical protein QJQ45_010876 [Haematococcus lacustris]|nr:hypothetical protein QJQ45_010876 [Haematococcus lacustris]